MMKTFKDRSQLETLTISNSKHLSISFFAHGGLFQIMADDIMVNQVLGHPIDGSMQNIYVRIKDQNNISYYPLLGPTAKNTLSVGQQSASWSGTVEQLAYTCSLVLDKDDLAWNWNIDIQNTGSNACTYDVIYAQDIGIANEGGVRINEAYCSQYIDQYVFETETGYAIASRQNQKTSKGHAWLAQGSLQNNIAYVTDGFSFYGLSYKETGVPAALLEDKLISEKVQYECSFVALQSDDITLKAQDTQAHHFYAHLQLDHPAATAPEDATTIAAIAEQAHSRLTADKQEIASEQAAYSLFNKPALLNGDTLTTEECESLFPGNKRHEEFEGDTRLSFFYDDHSYVTLKEKELRCERPHGHILRSGNKLTPGNDDILSTTNYMYGVFHSHITIGNTSFNKFLSIMRSPLNIFKSSGQRVFVKISNEWTLLSLPSAYELSASHSKWIYKTQAGTITVRAWTTSDHPVAHLDINSDFDAEFLISHNLTVGNNEWENTIDIDIDDKTKTVKCTTGKESLMAQNYADSAFYIGTSTPDLIASISDDSLLLNDSPSQNWPYIVFQTKTTQAVSISFTGDILSAEQAKKNVTYIEQANFEQDVQHSSQFWTNIRQDLNIQHGTEDSIAKINDILKWYVHNGMIHYSTPHGLEQFSGAAWGLRDVCQGPAELFLATHNYAPVRDILKMVFEQQYIQTGDWPQWFMFDRYVKIQHAESHGDIIVWPLKALADYIETANDPAILNEQIAYTDETTFDRTTETESLFEHVQKTVATIESRFIAGTHLSCYGEGDWDDTLQPADEGMRKHMVSAWTVALTYQTFGKLAKACAYAGKTEFANKLTALSEAIKKDFNEFLIKDKVSSGFVYFNEDKTVDYMLHPSDTKLGLKYRLLPMTRSMIAELFTPEQMKSHLALIEQHLNFPDGVHLMDAPVTYKGGPRKYFRRADEAANFGREIGLQYVHAHIRYIEAMCKIGEADKAYESILKIIPITIQKAVPNAMIRQSNAYFSSSDGNFRDRYEAKQGFSDLKQGKVQVKGGWRIYSSGPGIFLNQVVSQFLGIRLSFGSIVFDPIMPQSLDGLTQSLDLLGSKITFTFHIRQTSGPVSKVLINDQEPTLSYEDNPYRQGGATLTEDAFKSLLNTEKQNQVNIFVG